MSEYLKVYYRKGEKDHHNFHLLDFSRNTKLITTHQSAKETRPDW